MGLWEAAGSLESNQKVHRVVDGDVAALAAVPSLSLPLLRIPTQRLIGDVDPRRERGVFEGHSG